MALNETQTDQLTVYVRDNPDAIPEFDSTVKGITPNDGWAVASDALVTEIMNMAGKVPGQTLDREFMPVWEFWDCIQQTRGADPVDDYKTRSEKQRQMLSDLLRLGYETGIPLDDQKYPQVDAKVKWIFGADSETEPPNTAASATLQELGTKRARPATPAEHLYTIEHIRIQLTDAQRARDQARGVQKAS